MTAPNRTALLNKIYKTLKKHYKMHLPRGEQPLLQSILFACCLENARHETAEQVFETLKSSFFDWNEVRVSTVKELAEVMQALPDPSTAATHLKGVLQSVFESEYSFDLESLKRQNLGQAVKRLQKLDGATPFVVAYATQHALGGHAIPLDRGTLGALVVLGVINESEADSSVVPGMERAIPKSKGQEFGALVHQLGSEFFASPFSTSLRELLLSIAPDAKDRMPKRGVKKPVPEPVPEPAGKKKGLKELPAKAPAKHPAAKEAISAKKKSAPAKKAVSHGRKAVVPHAKKKPSSGKKVALKSLPKRKPR